MSGDWVGSQELLNEAEHSSLGWLRDSQDAQLRAGDVVWVFASLPGSNHHLYLFLLSALPGDT